MNLIILLSIFAGILYFLSTIFWKWVFNSIESLNIEKEIIYSLVGRPLGIIACFKLIEKFYKKEIILSVAFGIFLLGPAIGFLLFSVYKLIVKN